MKNYLFTQLALRWYARSLVALLLLTSLVACGRSELELRYSEAGVVDARVNRDGQTDVVGPDANDPVVSLQITPPNASTIVNGVSVYTALARLQSGRTVNVTGASVWTSSDDATARFRTPGTIVGVRQGSVRITATYMGMSAFAQLTVIDAQLVSIMVTPNRAMVPPGTTQTFIANGRFSNGQNIDVTDMCNWASSAPNIARMVAPGRVTAVMGGVSNITCMLMGRTGAATIVVSNLTVRSLSVAPMTSTVGRGAVVRERATATFSDGSMADVTEGVTWTSSNMMVATVSNTAGSRGTVNTLSPGNTTITASLTVGAMTVTAMAMITVNNATLESIAIRPGMATVGTGATQQFTAIGAFSDGTTQDITDTCTWTSSDPAIATVGDMPGSKGLGTGVRAGRAEMIATLNGMTGRALLTVTGPLSITSIAVTPPSPTVARGTSQTFTATATFNDGSTADVTAMAMWVSSNPAVASLRANVATALTMGTTTITATVGMTSGSATLTVPAARIVSVAVTPPSANLAIGGTQQLMATATLDDMTTQDVTATAMWTSASDPTATVSAGGLVTGRSAGMTTITASINGVSGTATITVRAPALQSISVTPISPTLAVGVTQQFRATGIFNDGSTSDLTAAVTWTSSDPTVLTVAMGGLARAVAGGAVVLSASVGGVTGTTMVTVTAARLTGITVTPAMSTLSIGATAALRATGMFNDGSTVDITTSVTWSSSQNGTASVSNAMGSQGLVTALMAGSVTITASQAGVMGTAMVTVSPAVLQRITITPANPSSARGTTVQFAATGTFNDGSTRDITDTVTWSSSNAAVASISNAAGSHGLASALTVGNATITATLGGVNATTTLTVTAAVLQSITLLPVSGSLRVGQTMRFIARGTYGDGTTADITTMVTWTASNPAVAGVSNAAGSQGTVTALSAGMTNIVATLGGVSGSAPVTVVTPMLIGIQIQPLSPRIFVGQAVMFTAVARYSDGSTQNINRMAVWTSSAPGVAAINAFGQALALAEGTTNITATYMGFTATTTLTVVNPVLVAIQIAPVNPTIRVGTMQPFSATGIYSDGSSRPLTQLANWTSSNPAVAQITNGGGGGPGGGMRGVATAASAGMTTITATYMGVSSTETLTVTNPVIVSITVAPAADTATVGQTRQFTASAIFDDGTSQDITGQSTWVSSNPAVAQITSGGGGGPGGGMRGLATAITAGTVTITATYMGVSGTARFTVSAAVLMSITVSPATAMVGVGATQQFTASAIFSDGSSQTITNAATWTSSNVMVAQVTTGGGPGGGMRGLATGLSVGTVTITAAYMGMTGTAMFQVTAARITSIQVTPLSPSVPVGTMLSFQATAIYSDGTSRNVTQNVTWVSGSPMVASVNNTMGPQKGFTQTLAPGMAEIRATLDGITGTSTLRVTNAMLTRIQVTPFTPRIPNGFPVAFTATALYDDGTNSDITPFATWTSSAANIAQVSNTVGSKGQAQTLAVGSTMIVAQYNGMMGSTTLTVTNATLMSITVTPNAASIMAGGIQQFVATGNFNDGSMLTITDLVTWTSASPMIADISNAAGSRGQATGFSAGMTTITAQRGAVTGTAGLTVR